MNRTLLGILLGTALGLADVMLTVFGNRAERTPETFLVAFTSRFAIGFLVPQISMRMPAVLSGALVGVLISLPDAFAFKSYPGILGTGVVFGALAGLAVKDWARPRVEEEE